MSLEHLKFCLFVFSTSVKHATVTFGVKTEICCRSRMKSKGVLLFSTVSNKVLTRKQMELKLPFRSIQTKPRFNDTFHRTFRDQSF